MLATISELMHRRERGEFGCGWIRRLLSQQLMGWNKLPGHEKGH